MQIQAINSFSNIKTNQNPQFKSVYPVYHWVAEANGSYAPAVTKELSETLQRKIIRFLNRGKSITNPIKLALMDRTCNFIKNWDKSYQQQAIARSYYNQNGGWNGKFFEPISYIITGNDAEVFNSNFGKPIGEAKAISPKINGKTNSAELKIAYRDYSLGGLDFVKKGAKHFVDKNGIRYGLHTKFEIIRSKRGIITDYKLVDMKFLPESGEKNPFELLKQ